MKKRVLAILLASLMLFAISACASSSASTTPPPANTTSASAEPTTPVWPEPGSEITVVVNYAAGGAHDIMVRTMKPYLEKYLDCKITVENVDGGSGMVALQNFLSEDHSDGLTWVTWAYPKHDVESVQRSDGSAPFYSFEDFYSIGSVIPDTHMIMVPKNSPYNTLDEFAAYAKEHPGELVWSGSGTYPGVAGFIWEDVCNKYGIDVQYIPYGGGSQEVLTALLGNHTDIATAGVGDAYENYIKTGELKALCVCSNERNDYASDIPSFPEASGGKELEPYVGNSIRMVMIDGKCPDYIKEKCAEAFAAVANDPDFQADFAKTGYPLAFISADEANEARQSMIEAYSAKLASSSKS